jgi:hypothetical protein
MVALGVFVILIGLWWIAAAIFDWGILFWDWDAIVLSLVVGEQITRWLILAGGVVIAAMGLYFIAVKR